MSRDVQLVAGALDLHRRSGGDLPSVLDQVAATIRERVAVGREVRSLTAQARLSGWILGVLPIGFFAFLWLTSRRDIEGALSTPAGSRLCSWDSGWSSARSSGSARCWR
jgi:tight adherence protein B